MSCDRLLHHALDGWTIGIPPSACLVPNGFAFPTLARRFVQNGAEVLFNLSNNGYFGRSASAREQHLLVLRMRAAPERGLDRARHQ